jgi:sulfatase maturation enzyme AslB (radical SAM superfamily)
MPHYKTLEITTAIGCPMMCKYCPQSLLLSKYKDSVRVLSFENFKKILNKVPKDVRIDFSAFTEPFVNKECSKMIAYAYAKQYKIAVFTTAYGMSMEDFEKIKNVEFETFKLHLPDTEGITKLNITDEYIEILKKIKFYINNVSIMSLGNIDDRLIEIFGRCPIPRIHSRGDNVKAFYHHNHTGRKIMCSRQLPERGVVLPNGDVVLCCSDYGLKHILGNLLTGTYKSLYTGYEYAKVIEIMNCSNDEILCNRCIYAE